MKLTVDTVKIAMSKSIKLIAKITKEQEVLRVEETKVQPQWLSLRGLKTLKSLCMLKKCKPKGRRKYGNIVEQVKRTCFVSGLLIEETYNDDVLTSETYKIRNEHFKFDYSKRKLYLISNGIVRKNINY